MNLRNLKPPKTFLSILLAAALSFMLMPSVAFATNGTGTNNNGTTKQNDETKALSYTGTGTKENPLKISNVQGLLDFTKDYNAGAFTDRTNFYVTLTDDIDLSGHTWDPIGSNKIVPFSGTFDGQGYAISGLSLDVPLTSGVQDRYYPCGLFGYVAQGEIKHLGVSATIKTVASENGVPCAGILIGMISPSEGASVSIEDCSVEGSVAVKGGNTTVAGGLVGCISLVGTNQNVSISEATSAASTITADTLGASFSGGFVGHVTAKATNAVLSIKGCEATGNVTITQTAKANKVVHEAGGFIGGLLTDGGTAEIELTKNTASGVVSTSGDVQYNDGGGFIGCLQALAGTCQIESCSASSEVKASSTASALNAKAASGSATATANETGNDTGGLIGYLLVDGGTVALSSVSATGPVSSQGTMTRNDSGGLIGFTDIQKGSALTIENSSASGTADARDSAINNAGGLLGWAEIQEASKLAISSSHAKGSATASSGIECSAGGLVGNTELSSNSGLSISNCSSSSETASSEASDYSESGGLLGRLSSSGSAKALVSSCFATGKATASNATDNYAGGLLGSVSSDKEGEAEIKDCYALGDASATGDGDYNDAGGLIGYAGAESATTSISFCYATGLATATGTAKKENAAGGMVGYGKALGEGSLTLANTVAANAFVTSSDSKNNLAGRVLGSFGSGKTAALSLEANFAWDGMLLNDETASDSDTNGRSADKAQLLTGSFWGSSEDEGMQIDSDQITDSQDSDGQSAEATSSGSAVSPSESAEGPSFNGAKTWDLVDGSLPLLQNPKGATYAPPYLKTTQSTGSSPSTRNIDIAPAIALIAGSFVAILFIWLIVYLVRRRRRA